MHARARTPGRATFLAIHRADEAVEPRRSAASLPLRLATLSCRRPHRSRRRLAIGRLLAPRSASPSHGTQRSAAGHRRRPAERLHEVEAFWHHLLEQLLRAHALRGEIGVGAIRHSGMLAVGDELGEEEVVAGDVDALPRPWLLQARARRRDDVIHVYHVHALVPVEDTAGRRVRGEAGADAAWRAPLAKYARDGEDGGATLEDVRLGRRTPGALHRRRLVHQLPWYIDLIDRRARVADDVTNLREVALPKLGGRAAECKCDDDAAETLRGGQIGPCVRVGQLESEL
mmetsp:Transcript_2397/g.6717  ORF Transcript_2397/g.6717 Transcript_2397/m.6717 type:complete len:287 (-) Transcript_2397:580-1440(-)